MICNVQTLTESIISTVKIVQTIIKSDLGWSISVGKSETFLPWGLFFPEDDMCERIQLGTHYKTLISHTEVITCLSPSL